MADMTGKTLGQYHLTERLGRGGMAEVYRAFQPSLERDVAIKVLYDYLAEDQSFVGRFRREAKAVASLRHQHIMQIFDFGVEDDVYYMVMEYIGGGTLEARLDYLHAEGRRMPLEEVVRIFHPLCDALDYAHEQGCIHRDIKPANVMFDGERLVLTDFGLVTMAGTTRYTATGAMLGTPAYMAPEQGRGELGSVQSDIYALGVILYQMVTGRLPYDADTPVSIALKHITEPLTPPSQVRDDVPPAVEQVVLKAMAKEPDARFRSAGELAGALEAAAHERAPSLAPSELRAGTTMPAATTKASPRRVQQWWIVGGVTALLAVALVLVALILPGLRTRPVVGTATPSTPQVSDSTQALGLPAVNDFLYQLQGIDLAAIANSAYDLVIMDYSEDGSQAGEYSAAQISTLKHGPGGDKIVLAYMSIGEAEDYRFYWQYGWEPGNPAWLDAENPDWEGNYKVHYWDPGWQAVVLDYTDRLLDAGFDGVYLDLVDAYEYYAEEGRDTAAQEMVDFVAALAAHARTRDPDFYVLPNNAAELAALVPAYLDSVDGIGQEDIYYGYEEDDQPTPPAVSVELEGYLDLFKSAGKLVLTIDYATTSAHVNDAYAKSRARGYVPFVTVRDLDRLTIHPGHEPD